MKSQNTFVFRPHLAVSEWISHAGSIASIVALIAAIILRREADWFFVILIALLIMVGISWGARRLSQKAFLTIDFIHNVEEGIITLGPAIRHVVLRAETIRRILKATIDASHGNLEVLSIVGRQVGNDFGEVLNRNIFSLYPTNDREKLTLWFNYDRFGGMGKFQSTGSMGDPLFFPPAEIRFENSFLPARAADPEFLCKFMAGYVQGVLEKVFPNHQWTTRVDCPRGPHEICVFDISYIRSSQRRLTECKKSRRIRPGNPHQKPTTKTPRQ